jgi:hypothetical protein
VVGTFAVVESLVVVEGLQPHVLQLSLEDLAVALVAVHPPHQAVVLSDEPLDGVPRIRRPGRSAVPRGEIARGAVHLPGAVLPAAGALVAPGVETVGEASPGV